MINPHEIKKDFPIFKNNPDLIYLDSTATTLKPQGVVDALTEYYEDYSASVHRGLYPLAARATKGYEDSREKIAAFIGAASAKEVVFTRNTTESLNVLAYTFESLLQEGDEIVTTAMEHHSNFLPWQALAERKGLTLTVLDVTKKGELKNIDEVLKQAISKRTKVVTLAHVSNVTGVVNPIKKIVSRIKAVNPECMVIVDGAQSVPHMPINVIDLGCDFFAFSLHKMLGPTGVGVLWGKKKMLEILPPFLYGGEMVESVTWKKSTYKEVPHRFEAGTPHIAGVIAASKATEYLAGIGMEEALMHEKKLLSYGLSELENAFGSDIVIIGPKDTSSRIGSLAFLFKEHHPHDIAELLGEQGICVRAGRHCAAPLHIALAIQASVRASFYVYSDRKDIDTLIEGLKKVDAMLSK
ncbi:SufS family cysteine desulfurase [Patescibacteria group bacterium]|nr:SufS family cysteine desulfurase [Patescibacteria group bacterium]